MTPIEAIILLINQTLVSGGLTSAAELKSILLGIVDILSNIDTSGNTVDIDGRTFSRIIKHPTNNNPANVNIVEVNDVIVDGWWDNNEYWGKARLIAADITVKANWQRLDYIDEIPVI